MVGVIEMKIEIWWKFFWNFINKGADVHRQLSKSDDLRFSDDWKLAQLVTGFYQYNTYRCGPLQIFVMRYIPMNELITCLMSLTLTHAHKQQFVPGGYLLWICCWKKCGKFTATCVFLMPRQKFSRHCLFCLLFSCQRETVDFQAFFPRLTLTTTLSWSCRSRTTLM